ncbi:MAG: tetratricopeptide repeat protein [Cryomorphaceae bacterium]|nr:tetratricopeptide repeat protein [Cryomorphaceae bacterium]
MKKLKTRLLRNYLLFSLIALAAASCGQKAADASEGSSEDARLDSLNAVLKEEPENVKALVARADWYLQTKNFPYAKMDAMAAFTVDSNDHDALRVLGDAHYVSNETRISRDAWMRCAKLFPKEVECRLKLAELYQVVMEYEKSIQVVDEVLKLDPNNATAYYIKGVNIRDQKLDTNMALAYIQKAIDLDPKYEEALDMAGVLHSAMNSPLAVSYFERLAELRPNDFNVYYKVGMYHLNTRNWNSAIEAFTQATQLNPKDAESYYNLGFIHLELQMYREARQYFTQSIEARAVNYRAHYARAFVIERLGDLKAAEADYLKALEYNPSHAPSQEGLGRVRAGLASFKSN